MGWGDCGEDSNGRRIGYSWEAICDHPGCDEEIDRGISFACGGMHGDDEYSCEKYYCEKHKRNFICTDQGKEVRICDECYYNYINGGEWSDENMTGFLVKKNN